MKSKDNPVRNTKPQSYSLSNGLAEEVYTAAFREGMNASKWVDQVLRNAVEKAKKQNKPTIRRIKAKDARKANAGQNDQS